jgi:hypothetical protein
VLLAVAENVHIQPRLVAGVTAVKTSAGRHTHIAHQHRPKPQVMHLITQTLNKQNQVRMTKVASLIGTHHLIGIGLQRQFMRANNTAIREGADRLRCARTGWVIFCQGVAAWQVSVAKNASSAIAILFIVTSEE